MVLTPYSIELKSITYTLGYKGFRLDFSTLLTLVDLRRHSQ